MSIFRKKFLCLLAVTAFYCAGFALNVRFDINTGLERAPISPYIYGTNEPLTNTEGWTARRQGGNRYTGYNWENNASHAGTDYYNSSDNYLCRNILNKKFIPGIVVTAFHDSAQARGCYSLTTLQMAGYVSADRRGTVDVAQTAPSSRFREVRATKGAPFSLTPDTTDDYVYMDEEMNFLVNKYGNASTPSGIKGYCLDNEPALWPSTHPRIHPQKPLCQELVTKSIALSKAIKSIDPYAETFGPVAYGFAEFLNFQGAPDWNNVKSDFGWFLDYYLDSMKKASDSAGKRLLDVLDIHWYPEATGGGERIVWGSNPTARANAEARIQAPRTLWDSSYVENSWIGQGNSPVALLKHLKSSVDKYYPGTKISISEFTYGGENHISGAIAMIDALGIFGKFGIYFASYWPDGDSTKYTSAAYKMFRNYNGNKATYGNVKVKANTNNVAYSSVFASVFDTGNNDLHLIAINKSYDSTLTASFNIAGTQNYLSARVWALNKNSSNIAEISPVNNITANAFSYTLPPLTVFHFVLSPANFIIKGNGNKSTSENYTIYEKRGFTINYMLPEKAVSTLSILDINGRLIKEFKNLSGAGDIHLQDGNNLNKLCAGLYFAVLKSERIQIHKRLMIIKD
jgi:hypothetical protein